jgi:hypothetical protein
MIGFWYGSGLTLKSIPMVAVDVSGSKVSSQYLINTIACVDHGQRKDEKQPFPKGVWPELWRSYRWSVQVY